MHFRAHRLFSPEFFAMRPVRVSPANARFLVACLAALLWPALAATANTIDVRLNINYEIPSDPLSGGTWSLEAKSGGAGIVSLNLRLAGINTAVSTAPIGTLDDNGDLRDAGFFIDGDSTFGSHRNIVIGQQPLDPETLFYGVGTLIDGSPMFPGKQPTWNSIGPDMPNLTDVSNVPWAPGPSDPPDAAWDTAATFLTGTFNDGQTPAFFADAQQGIVSKGYVFTSVGSPSVAGSFSHVNPLTSMIVRTNLMTNMADADYNNDGTVNAADYTIWRNTLGSTTMLDADGSGPSGVPDNLIDNFDYLFWKEHYGETVPGSGAISGDLTVPEPNSAWLLAFGTILSLALSRKLRGRGVAGQFVLVSAGAERCAKQRISH
jgi:hypothetical protein